MDSDLTGMQERGHGLRADPLFWIALVALPVFLMNIGSPALNDGEAMYAQIAREMRETGDWITPHLNGNRHFDKPPLTYWLVATAQSIFGESEASSRLWSAMAAWATIPLVGLIGRSLYGYRAGWMASLAQATSLGPFIFGSMLMPDSILIFWITLAMLGYIRGFALEKNNLWLWVMFVSIALSTLTKGILGLGLSSAVIGLHVILTRRFREFLQWPFWAGAAIFAAVSVPWHFAVARANHDFLQYYFIREHLHRFTGQRYPSDEFVPLFLFLTLTFLWTFPWICVVPQALWKSFRRLQSMAFRHSHDLLPLVWVAFFLLLFSASKSRLEYYALPSIPAFALLVGKFWDDAAASNPENGGSGALTIPLTIMAILMASTALAALVILGPAKEVLFEILSTAWPTGGIEESEGQRAILERIRIPTIVTFTGVALVCSGAAAAARKSRAVAAQFLLAGMMIPFFMLTQWGFKVVEPYHSAKAAAILAVERTSPQDMIVFQEPHEYMWVGGMAFYTKRPVYILKDPRFENLAARRREPPERFLNEAGLLSLWQSSRKVVLVGREIDHLAMQLFRVAPSHIIGARGPWTIIENRQDRGSP